MFNKSSKISYLNPNYLLKLFGEKQLNYNNRGRQGLKPNIIPEATEPVNQYNVARGLSTLRLFKKYQRLINKFKRAKKEANAKALDRQISKRLKTFS